MQQLPGLAGGVALVTGGSAGIGRSSALGFAANGARVVILDVNESGGREVVSEIEKLGIAATFVKGDVTSEGEVQEAVDTAVRNYGRLDFAHNNAGIFGPNAPITEQTLEGWSRVLDLNTTGVFLCMRAELRVMTEQGSGAIVNTLSTAGRKGIKNIAPYVASKFAVDGLTRSAAIEAGPFGVRVNSICPGTTRTPQYQAHVTQFPEYEAMATAAAPLRRVGEPAEVAACAVWLCSSAASFVTGSSIYADGGILAG